MRTLFFILIIFIHLASCSHATDKTFQGDNRFDTLPLPKDSSQFYFKTKTEFEDPIENSVDTFINEWYSKMLFALKEPILKDYRGNKEIYRFTWLRTFHHPISIRLEKQGEIMKLFTKVSNGAGGYEPRQLIIDTTISLSKAQFRLFEQKIDSIGLWRLRTEQNNETGKDGSEWIIEAIKSNNYHMVHRWTPSYENEGNFRIVGEYLISLAQLEKEELEFMY